MCLVVVARLGGEPRPRSRLRTRALAHPREPDLARERLRWQPDFGSEMPVEIAATTAELRRERVDSRIAARLMQQSNCAFDGWRRAWSHGGSREQEPFDQVETLMPVQRLAQPFDKLTAADLPEDAQPGELSRRRAEHRVRTERRQLDVERGVSSPDPNDGVGLREPADPGIR